MSVTIVRTISPETVKHVYSGKAGECACGCKGKHSYASSIAAQGKQVRGYEFDACDISDKNIARICKLLNDNLGQVQFFADMAYVDLGTRTYVAYFA